MKGFNFASVVGLGRTTAWTCRKCTVQAQTRFRAKKQLNGFATRAKRIPRPKKRTGIILTASGGTLGLAAVGFTDDVKHAYEAAERTGRVVSALFVNINEYGSGRYSGGMHADWT